MLVWPNSWAGILQQAKCLFNKSLRHTGMPAAAALSYLDTPTAHSFNPLQYAKHRHGMH